MSAPTTTEPYLAKQASANSISLILVPFTIAAGLAEGKLVDGSTATT